MSKTKKRYYQIIYIEKERLSGGKDPASYVEFSLMLAERDNVICGIRGHSVFLNDMLNNFEKPSGKYGINDSNDVAIRWYYAQNIIRNNFLKFSADTHSPLFLGSVIFIDSYIGCRKMVNGEDFSVFVRTLEQIVGYHTVVWVVSKPPEKWIKNKCSVNEFVAKKEKCASKRRCNIVETYKLNEEYIRAILKKTKHKISMCKTNCFSGFNIFYDAMFLLRSRPRLATSVVK